jgi:hypothetical protein
MGHRRVRLGRGLAGLRGGPDTAIALLEAPTPRRRGGALTAIAHFGAPTPRRRGGPLTATACFGTLAPRCRGWPTTATAWRATHRDGVFWDPGTAMSWMANHRDGWPRHRKRVDGHPMTQSLRGGACPDLKWHPLCLRFCGGGTGSQGHGAKCYLELGATLR